MIFRFLTVLLLLLGLTTAQSKACTVAVISGKYTRNGRPLLWKNRDTWAVHNKIMYFDDAKYKYQGLVNSGDSKGKSVWIGVNSEGFAIMNSASYNLNLKDTAKLTGLEGKLIKRALGSCATLADFEKLLDELPRPTGLEANFGVIDGQGGAAMYEVSQRKYVKFDANDPTVAPFGYVLRANYSFTGSYGPESSGYLRYNTVNQLFYDAAASNRFDSRFIIQDVTRCLKHSLTKADLYRDYAQVPANTPTYTFFHDFVPRRSSASSVVVEGVKKGENPKLATMWSVVGFPLTSVVVPTWVEGGSKLPQVVSYKEQYKDSPVCHAALTLKKEAFNIRWGKFASKYYININALVNANHTGITEKIRPYEDEIFQRTQQQLKQWREEGISKKAISEYYQWLDKEVSSLFSKEFDIEL